MFSLRKSKGQAGIYIILSLFLMIAIAASFTMWSLNVSSLSGQEQEEFRLSLIGRRISNALDLTERNKVGIRLETAANISFNNSVIVCGRKCISVDSPPPGDFRILQHPNGLTIEK